MSCGLTRGIIASVILAMSAMAAFAHAKLQKAAVPTDRVAGAISPREIRLKFSEDVEPGVSEIALATQGSVLEPFRPGRVDPDDSSVIVVRLRKVLEPGIYNVMWHAVSVDTHRTEGSFAFVVAP